jgi:hypothetical protein
MSDLVYNTTSRNHSRFVRRDPRDPDRLEGFVVSDDGRSIETVPAGITDPSTFCRPAARAHLFGPPPGAYRFAERMGAGKSSKWANPHGRFAHGNLVVGRRRLVNKDVKRGFRVRVGEE